MTRPTPHQPFALPGLDSPPRGPKRGEDWERCCTQERAYTLGWRAGRGAEVGSSAKAPYRDGDDRRWFWALGFQHATGGKAVTDIARPDEIQVREVPEKHE